MTVLNVVVAGGEQREILLMDDHMHSIEFLRRLETNLPSFRGKQRKKATASSVVICLLGKSMHKHFAV